jgi:cytochrome c553
MNMPKWLPFASKLVPAVLLIAPFARGEERSSPPAIVTRYCSGCHAIDGKSQLPYIPRLAGLNAEYTERKLADFRAAAPSLVDEKFNRVAHIGSFGKPDGFTSQATAQMVGPARAISETDLQAAAAWYSTQQPAPGKQGKRQAIEEGGNLYVNGLESQRIPACQTCHGPGAQGTDTAPRLAGQHAAYLLGQLAQFRSSNRAHSPMTEVARSLENGQALALAAYLQSR